MAFGARTVLNSATGTTGGTTFASGSISPASNSLLVAVCATASAAVSTHLEPTLAGLSLTWTRRASIESSVVNRYAVAIFTAPAGSSPGSGAVTVTWQVAGLRHIMHIVEIASGYDSTTPVLQSKASTSQSKTPSVVLDATPETDSLVIAAIMTRPLSSANDIVPSGAMAELAESNSGSSPTASCQVQEDLDNASATCGWTLTDNTNGVMAAIEIAIAAGGGGTAYTQSTAGTLGLSGAAIKSTAKAFAGTLGLAGAMLKSTSKALIGTLGLAGSMVKSTAKSLVGTLGLAGALTTSLTYLASVEGTLGLAGALIKSTAKEVVGTLGLSGALVKATDKIVAGTLGLAGDISKSAAKLLGGTLGLAGALTSTTVFLMAIAGTLGLSGTVTKSTNKFVEGTLGLAGVISKAIAKSISGVLGLAGALLGILVGEDVLDIALSDSAVYSVSLAESLTYTVSLGESSPYTVSIEDTSRS